jgi:hypothetical protein
MNSYTFKKKKKFIMVKDKQVSLNLGTYSLFSTLKTVALIVALLIMVKMYFGERDLRIEQELLIEVSTDELETWKNKDGENVAKIQVLETQSRETFLAFKSQDSTIQELQQLVKDNKRLFKNAQGSASIVKSETNIDVEAVTQVTQDSITGSPVYTSDTKTKWYEINTVASEDTTKIKLKTVHSLSLVMGSESQGLSKKRKTYAIAKDDNPYSDIKDMRIYNVTENKKSFVVGPYAGLGVSGSGGVVRTGWQIGFGVTYKLLEF